MIARDIYQIPIEVDCNLFDFWWINRKLRKNFNKVKKANVNVPGGFWVPYLAESVSVESQEVNGMYISFIEVYDAYYKGSII